MKTGDLKFSTCEDCGEMPCVCKNTAEQETVDFILNMQKEGFSLTKIAGVLNSREIPTRKGKTWHASTVSYVLKNKIECRHKNKRIRNFLFWCDECENYV